MPWVQWPCPKWHPKPLRSSSESALSLLNATLMSGRSLLRSSLQRGPGRSADRGRITDAKGALASILLNAKMRNGTPYGLVDLMDTRTHEVFHLGQGQCCQLSNFFLHLATNLAIIFKCIWQLLRSDSDNKKAHIFHPNYTKRKPKMPISTHITWIELVDICLI